ncbi:outer membrane lipoprotein carrier protein [Arenicella xantha]|uniref:Outer-membrane lipoprotein carrier protein n=2 Tax=Arenicella xantha TaxID=644221 RepID=A0A395JH36_9GAMM|nr:outer membrane lipoprotein carrier protein [Arenicella xantha]
MLNVRQVLVVPLVLAVGFGWSVVSLASEAMLRSFFADVDTLQADFTQRVTDESGMTLEFSSGVFSLSRPGRFRWDYKSDDPDLEQGMQIVSDGVAITFYEPDLATATIRSFDQAVQQVPTMALVQAGDRLDKLFTIVDYGLTDGLSWVALKPKDENAGYQELMIGFNAGKLNTIVLTDALGNETRLVLSKLQANRTLPTGTFKLDLSSDVDVVQ